MPSRARPGKIRQALPIACLRLETSGWLLSYSSRHFEQLLFVLRCFRFLRLMLSKLQSILKALTMGRKGGGFYAVQTGRKTGIFRTWY